MEESNPWPTFVDAFSTVLCIFIFLMLIFVLNSMLIMYESARKHYVPETGVAHSIVSNITSTDPTDGTSLSKENLDANKSSSAGAQAESEPDRPVQMSSEAVKSEVMSQKNRADTLAQSAETATENNQNKTVVELAQNPSAAESKGSETGRFDLTDNKNPTFDIKNNQFIIHFNAMEQGYSTAVIDEMNKWLKTSGKKPVSVTLYTPDTPSVSVSDAMRLTYQRGIILLKTVKTPYPGQEVAFSVINDPAVMSNSAVVTVSE